MAEEYKPVTAQQKLDPHTDKNEPEVSSSVSALENYEAREDVETLANRRARENGTSFEETEAAGPGVGDNDKDSKDSKSKSRK